MASIVAAAWRLVLERARADRLLLGAALLTILLATTLLAAGPIYADAVTVSGLRRALQDAPTEQANVQVSVNIPADQYAGRDEHVLTVASQTFAPIGGRIERSARSSSFALPGQAPDAVKDLAVFAFYRGIEEHATLVAGAWPGAGGGDVVEAAIPAPAARLLGLQPGSTLELTNRLDETLVIRARVTGTYQVNDPSDPYWWGDPLDLDGVQPGTAFTTYGPFVTTPEVFLGRPSAAGAKYIWRVYPHFDRSTVPMLSGMIAAVDRLPGRLNSGLGANDQYQTQTDLGAILRDAQRSLLVTRTGVLVVTVQLAILAGYALLLTAGLLVDQRRVETALLNARGASTGQIVTMALMEALLLAIPAALAGPWLAALSLRILNHAGPLASIALPLRPRVTGDAYLLSALAALGCVLALALPSLQAARSFVQTRAARGRPVARGLAQRAGIDLILVAAAALAYWQLRRYGAPITRTVQGRIGLDPLLVAAPAIGLLAGAVLALRVIPLLARVVDRLAARLRALVPALGAWQLARRPAGYARSALLLMLAVAVGLFALAYSATWGLSQRDQADYQVGADVRVRPDIRSGVAIPQRDLAQAQGQIDGVTISMPATRDYLQPSRSAQGGRLLALDSVVAPGVVQFRPDLADAPFSAMMSELAAARPALPAIPLPGEPRRLALDLRMTLDPVPPDALAGIEERFRPRPEELNLSPRVEVTVQDARGMLYQLDPQRFDHDGATHRLVFPLASPLAEGRVALPEYPLAVVSIVLDLYPNRVLGRSGLLQVAALQASAEMEGDAWAPVPLAPDQVAWKTTQYGLRQPPSSEPVPAGPGQLGLRFSTGQPYPNSAFSLSFALKPAGPDIPNGLPALASDAFLRQTATGVGDTLPIDLAGARRDVHIVGAYRAFPTLDPNQPTLVVDLPTLAMLRFQSSGDTLDPAERWLATAPGRRDAVVAALKAPPYSSVEINDRVARDLTLRTDPVALGIIGALTLGTVAAALFAALGFAVSAAVSSWARLTEFALLRALGLSPRQLSGWLSLENGLLVAISLLGGTALGLLLAWLILPLVSLTQAASRTVPEVIVIVPWRSVLLLEVSSLVVLAVVIGLLAATLRRIGLGSTLRLGEE